MAVLAAVLSALGVSACGGEALRTAADASHYVDDLVRGASRSARLADDASPVARAAVADSAALRELHSVVEDAPGVACAVIGLISNIADALPDSTAPLSLNANQVTAIKAQALLRGDPQTETDRVVDAALNMAQSTFVDAADKTCNIAQSL